MDACGGPEFGFPENWSHSGPQNLEGSITVHLTVPQKVIIGRHFLFVFKFWRKFFSGPGSILHLHPCWCWNLFSWSFVVHHKQRNCRAVAGRPVTCTRFCSCWLVCAATDYSITKTVCEYGSEATLLSVCIQNNHGLSCLVICQEQVCFCLTVVLQLQFNSDQWSVGFVRSLTILSTRKSVPGSSRQLDHMKTSWPS